MLLALAPPIAVEGGEGIVLPPEFELKGGKAFDGDSAFALVFQRAARGKGVAVFIGGEFERQEDAEPLFFVCKAEAGLLAVGRGQPIEGRAGSDREGSRKSVPPHAEKSEHGFSPPEPSYSGTRREAFSHPPASFLPRYKSLGARASARRSRLVCAVESKNKFPCCSIILASVWQDYSTFRAVCTAQISPGPSQICTLFFCQRGKLLLRLFCKREKFLPALRGFGGNAG